MAVKALVTVNFSYYDNEDPAGIRFALRIAVDQGQQEDFVSFKSDLNMDASESSINSAIAVFARSYCETNYGTQFEPLVDSIKVTGFGTATDVTVSAI